MNSEEMAWKIRRHVVEMTHRAHASHIGGALSCADILAVLYTEAAVFDTKHPSDENRDRIILSKGHSGAALYAALAESGFFPVEELSRYGQNGSRYSCHISHKGVPGVEISTGSLGHGVCVAAGMALNGKLRKKRYKVYAIAGDGECNECSVWEMALMAAHYRLDNFIVVIDRNGMQAMGFCDKVMNTEPLDEKWEAFGWKVVTVKNGNDHRSIKRAFDEEPGGRPKVIIADTVKGKGISFMENELLWHYRDPQGEFYERAVAELEEKKPCGIMR